VSFDNASVAEALAVVRGRVVAAGGGDDVRILPVTKSFGPEAVVAALAAGCTAVGENYAQEVVAKREVLSGVEVHFIGQLQTNKVRQLADLVSVYETVDRVRLAHEIAKRAPGAHILIQVDTADEPGKGGCPLDQLDGLVDEATALGLSVDGLMTVGPTSGDPDETRRGFRQVRAAVDRLGLGVCSMGMTGDLEIAVQEGSTQLRIGTALFGRRTVPGQRDQAR
jgi:pyridoxal phosphate enzyme (YggS family)